MSKCLTSFELLRAIVQPENPENADIMAHLYVCDKCLNALKEWRQSIAEAEYVPQPGDDEAAADAVKNVLEQKYAWERLVVKCRNFFSSFNGFSFVYPQQLVFAPTRHRLSLADHQQPVFAPTHQVRKVTEAPVFLFNARPNVPTSYQWHAQMTLPINATISSDIQIAIEFVSLPQDVSLPENLFFQGNKLPIKDGVAHISCKAFLSSAKPNKGEIYVQYEQNNGKPPYKAYGDLKPL